MTRKTAFFEEWSWFKFNNLGLALGTNLKFYTSLSKGSKLKARKFLGVILTFVEVTGEKLVGGGLNRVNIEALLVVSLFKVGIKFSKRYPTVNVTLMTPRSLVEKTSCYQNYTR